MNQRYINQFGIGLFSASLIFMSVPGDTHAAPGVLSNKPLYVSAVADPNIMMIIDSSGSMRHIVAEDFTHTFTCDNAASQIPDNTTVYLVIDSGAPKIRYSGSDYTLGNTGATRCFVPGRRYYGELHTQGNSGSDRPAYTAEYLNWYFDASSTTGTWGNHKPGTRQRIKVAQDTIKDLVDSIKKINLGIASFNGQNGADINQTVLSLNPDDADYATNVTTLKSSIDGISASGYTPLAETMRSYSKAVTTFGKRP